MSEENVEVVREIWDAYSRGDFDQIRAHSDPAVVMITVQEGPLYGIEAVRKNQERWWEAWEDWELEVEEFVASTKLSSMGISIDSLTPELVKCLND